MDIWSQSGNVLGAFRSTQKDLVLILLTLETGPDINVLPIKCIDKYNNR